MGRVHSKICQLFLIALLLFSISSCAHFSADPDSSEPPSLPKEIEASYAYHKYQGDYKNKLLSKNSHYTLQRFTFPSNDNIQSLQHDITIDYYAINSAKKVPIILVLPIFGGANNIASTFARYFTEHGFATAIVHRQNRGKYLKQPNQIMRQMVFDHKQAIDWIESRPELDASRIGVFGVSMGGIKSALISALDRRIATSVIALAGGDLPYILTHTDQKSIKKERETILAEKGITVEELQQELSKKIECDPINYAQYIDASKTLMILAVFDNTVAFHKGVELKEKIGDPETIYLLSGHYSSIIYLPYVKYQSRKFLQKQLQ